MSKPDSNPQKPLWMDRLIGRSREALRRMNFAHNGVRRSDGWIIGLVVCTLLAGVISLAALGREGAEKKEGASEGASASTATNIKATRADAERNAEAPAAGKVEITAEKKSEAAGRTAGAKEEGELAAPNPKAQTSQDSGGANPKAVENEQESPDLIRARAAWFHDQRAYPNEHIPPGALQKAIEQRDLMNQRQKAAAAGSQFGSSAVISFPGDALWHLTGPQPVNELFSVNSGFPTASGRVTAIAVDPSDTTGQTVYIGGAAGGVWKTTDGGTTWTALTDAQLSLSIGSITVDPNNS